jgi:SAM-dependent methyltransferase
MAFTKSAEYYDAIYFAFKDYALEATQLAERVRTLLPGARTLLDVACGTGEHARLLSQQHGFDVTGIDVNPDFIRIARSKNPSGRFQVADMVDFDLAAQYDAVICMFSSIGYVRTLPALESALRCFKAHTAPGGVIIVEPWFPPGKLTPGPSTLRRAETAAFRVERTATTELDFGISRLRFDYTVESAEGVDHFSEVHELGLFTEEETLLAFNAAGLDAQHEAASSTHRGLYIARRTG